MNWGMMMTEKEMNDLEQLLAKVLPPEMPEDLSARMLADADRVQAGWRRPSPSMAPVTPGIWAQLLNLLGGWPSLGGLVTACAAGVWIGFAPPSFLPDPVILVMGSELELELDLMGIDGLEDAVSEDG